MENICYSNEKMAKQLKLGLRQWGGKRKGAGRPRTRQHPGLEGPGVPHLARPEIDPRHPTHVTLRVRPGVGYLRQYRRAQVLVRAFEAGCERFGMRVVHYVILGNHLHLIVEAAGAEALSRGMQGLAIRIAKQINKLQRRSGGVFVDRYHAHTLVTRREVATAVKYLQGNYRKHTHEYVEPRWHDPLAGTAARPRTWLLRTAVPAG
jgi:REP element-mobilizing transposase RayT